METRGVGEAALLGMAAGMRSMVPLAALGLMLTRRRFVGVPLALASAAELVYDKLPRAGERTAPGPLSVRVSAGALAGGIAVRAFGTPIAFGAAMGALAALASTLLFHGARLRAARRVPALAAAVGEDFLAIGSSNVALRLLRQGS